MECNLGNSKQLKNNHSSLKGIVYWRPNDLLEHRDCYTTIVVNWYYECSIQFQSRVWIDGFRVSNIKWQPNRGFQWKFHLPIIKNNSNNAWPLIWAHCALLPWLPHCDWIIFSLVFLKDDFFQLAYQKIVRLKYGLCKRRCRRSIISAMIIT